MKANKYCILDDLGEKYLVGFEDGTIGYVVKEFDEQSGAQLRSDWFIGEISGSKRVNIPTEEGVKTYDIKPVLSINLGFSFQGAYVPECKYWIYVKDSYKEINADAQ